MADDVYSFGTWVRLRRQALVLSREELAHQVGVAEVSIRKIEADERRPSPQVAALLAQQLQLTPETQAIFVQVARGLLTVDQLPPPIPGAPGSAIVAPAVPTSAPAPTLPSGTVTFLFTDIEGSTRLWEQHPTTMRAALVRHDTLLHQMIAAHGGTVFKTAGDGVNAAFSRAPNALHAALSMQRALQAESWGVIGALRVRIALHSGASEERGGDYFGPALNRVARLLACGHGDQILLSLATAELVREHLPPDAELRDLGTHRLKDLSRPEQIFQLATPDLPAAFPPLNTLDARRTNLPAQPTPLIGREHDVAAVCALLRRTDVRLVTLSGPGGTGKTRLALQVTAELIEDFSDGLYFVDLAPIHDSSLVTTAIATTLGVRESGGQPLLERLKGYLHYKRLVLLLDNFEHLLDAAALVAVLLAATSHLKVLVTSRERLHLRGEQEVAVLPLAVPDPAHLPALDQLSQYAAVALFIQCAQESQPAFQVTNASAGAVAQICVQLDGLPLAIELAAARLKLFRPEALLTRLSNRLALLTGGPRDLPARQQTMRNTITWSYDLLSDAEQTLFRRLGVFVGGCTLEAAEAVCEASDLRLEAWIGAQTSILNPQASSLIDRLASLVDKSLLRREEGIAGEPRFTMLEIIREYALERLTECGEAPAAQQAHASFYQDIAERVAPLLHGPEQIAWLDRLDEEHANLRIALAWTFSSQSHVALGMRLAAALLWFWIQRNHFSEGYTWLQRAAALSQKAGAAPMVRANVLRAAGIMAQFWTEYAQAIPLLEESLSLARAEDDRTAAAEALVFLGWIARDRGDYVRAETLEAESLALYQAQDDAAGRGLALLSLGEVVLEQGQLSRATEYCEALLALCRDTGEAVLHIRALLRLGRIAYLQADYTRAQMLLVESRRLFQQMQAPSAVAEAQFELGRVARAQGDELEAKRLLIESLAGYRDFWSNKREVASCLEELAGLAAMNRQAVHAVRLFGAAQALRERANTPLPPVYQPGYERDVAAARTQLDAATFAAAWDAGRAVTQEQAIAQALDAI